MSASCFFVCWLRRAARPLEIHLSSPLGPFLHEHDNKTRARSQNVAPSTPSRPLGPISPPRRNLALSTQYRLLVLSPNLPDYSLLLYSFVSCFNLAPQRTRPSALSPRLCTIRRYAFFQKMHIVAPLLRCTPCPRLGVPPPRPSCPSANGSPSM